MKTILRIMIILAAAFIIIPAAGTARPKPAACINMFSGDVKVSVNGMAVKPARFLELYEGAEVVTGSNGSVEIFMISGKKISLSNNLHVEIKGFGVVGKNDAARSYLSGNSGKNIFNTAASRSMFKDKVLKEKDRRSFDSELAEIDKSIADPEMKSLAKYDLFQKYSQKKKANEEKKNYNKLRDARK